MDSLAKCISPIFTNDDVTAYKIAASADRLYHILIVSSMQSSNGNGFPCFPLLQKAEISEYREKRKMKKAQGRQLCSRGSNVENENKNCRHPLQTPTQLVFVGQYQQTKEKVRRQEQLNCSPGIQ